MKNKRLVVGSLLMMGGGLGMTTAPQEFAVRWAVCAMAVLGTYLALGQKLRAFRKRFLDKKGLEERQKAWGVEG